MLWPQPITVNTGLVAVNYCKGTHYYRVCHFKEVLHELWKRFCFLPYHTKTSLYLILLFFKSSTCSYLSKYSTAKSTYSDTHSHELQLHYNEAN